LARAQSLISLPTDAAAAKGLEDEVSAHVVPSGEIPEGEMGLDIGPQTVADYSEIIRSAKTIVWNGPMGVFEKDAFASGTINVAKAVANSQAVSIIGGGDSVAAVVKAGKHYNIIR
jgi:phosphoglycerate kinase